MLRNQIDGKISIHMIMIPDSGFQILELRDRSVVIMIRDPIY
mgnify:CR=1 FL=1